MSQHDLFCHHSLQKVSGLLSCKRNNSGLDFFFPGVQEQEKQERTFGIAMSPTCQGRFHDNGATGTPTVTAIRPVNLPYVPGTSLGPRLHLTMTFQTAKSSVKPVSHRGEVEAQSSAVTGPL